MAASGLDRTLGLTGAGALPLAVRSWWSVSTPVLAILVLTVRAPARGQK